VGGTGVAVGGNGVGVGVDFLAVQPERRAKTHRIKNILRNIGTSLACYFSKYLIYSRLAALRWGKGAPSNLPQIKKLI
jgi:hypothetical protein